MTRDQIRREVGEAKTSPPGRAGWQMVGLLMAVVAISHFNRISMPTAGTARIMHQYGIEPEMMGWIYSAFLITYTICMIPGGWVIDRFGAVAGLGIVLAGSAPFVALTGVVGLVARDAGFVFVALLIVRGVMGIVSAPLHPSCARVVGDWIDPGGRSRANGLVNGSALVGIAAAPPVFGLLMDRLDWPVTFLIASAVTAAMAITWLVVARDRPEPDAQAADSAEAIDSVSEDPLAQAVARSETSNSWTDLLRDRSLWFLTLSYGAVSYFQYLFFYWMQYYFQDVLHLSKSRSEFYAAIPTLAMGIGMPLGGWLSDRIERSYGRRWGRRVVPIGGMAAGAVLLGLGVMTREPAWIVTWFSMAMATVGAAEGPFWATAVELGGHRGGSAAAILNTGGNGGGLLAPIVTPWVGTHYGWGSAVILGSFISLAGAALWIGIDPVRKPLIHGPRRREVGAR